MYPRIIHNTDKLQELIKEHPDYPILVSCSEEVNIGGYAWSIATNVTYSLGEVLDATPPMNDEKLYCDRDDFYEELEEWLWDTMTGEMDEAEPTQEEVDKRFAEECAKYEEYWTPCICVWADV